MQVRAKGFANVDYLDAHFDENEMAEMREETYENLKTDFPGADIQVIGGENNGE